MKQRKAYDPEFGWSRTRGDDDPIDHFSRRWFWGFFLFALAAGVVIAWLISIVVGPAHAGDLTYEAPAEAIVVVPDWAEPGSMGGSGAWLVPLLALGLVALAVSNQDSDADGQPAPAPEPCDPAQ